MQANVWFLFVWFFFDYKKMVIIKEEKQVDLSDGGGSVEPELVPSLSLQPLSSVWTN